MTLEPVRDIRVTDHLPLVSQRTVLLVLRWLALFFGTIVAGILTFGTSLVLPTP
jgi:hypothetical protein